MKGEAPLARFEREEAGGPALDQRAAVPTAARADAPGEERL